MPNSNVKQIQVDLLEKLFDAKLKGVYSQMNEMQRSITRVDHSINGNGQPGLVQRMEAQERFRANILARMALLVGVFSFIGAVILAFAPAVIDTFLLHISFK